MSDSRCSISDTCIDTILEGATQYTSSTTAVIMQGPYIRNHTRTCIEEFLSRNSDILIIVSTYLPSSITVAEFLSPYEKARIADGVLVFIFVKVPSVIEWPDFWRTNQANQNLQRLTSFAGLRYAAERGIQFSLKIRSDTFLGRTNIIKQMREEVEKKYPVIHKTVSSPVSVKGRLTVSGQCTVSNDGLLPHAPFHVRDHFYFGYTSDVLCFFDMTAMSSRLGEGGGDGSIGFWNNGNGIRVSVPESAMTILWMENLGIVVNDTKELLARYFIVKDPWFVEQVRLDPKGPGGAWWSMSYTRYLKEGVPYVKEVYSKSDDPRLVTSHEQWLDFTIKLRH